jgi:hypothetical protein
MCRSAVCGDFLLTDRYVSEIIEPTELQHHLDKLNPCRGTWCPEMDKAVASLRQPRFPAGVLHWHYGYCPRTLDGGSSPAASWNMSGLLVGPARRAMYRDERNPAGRKHLGVLARKASDSSRRSGNHSMPGWRRGKAVSRVATSDKLPLGNINPALCSNKKTT